MFRDMFSGSRAIFIGVVFFVLVVGGSVLYYLHVRRASEAELQRSERFLREREKYNETHTAEAVNLPRDTETPGFVSTPDENTDTQGSDETKALPDETENLDFADTFLPEDFVSEEVPAEEVPVSPFGFGPYPEIPEDYPHEVSWINPSEKLLRPERREHRKRLELIDRVMVKEWTDGDHNFVGATGNGSGDGKVYLTYPNVIYVEYGEPYENDDGVFIRPIKDALSASYTLSPEEMRKGETPTGFTVIEYDDAGYDPYAYLDLP